MRTAQCQQSEKIRASLQTLKSIGFRSVRENLFIILSNSADRRTDQPLNKRRQKHNLFSGGIKRKRKKFQQTMSYPYYRMAGKLYNVIDILLKLMKYVDVALLAGVIQRNTLWYNTVFVNTV